jgi:hypothetical protein
MNIIYEEKQRYYRLLMVVPNKPVHFCSISNLHTLSTLHETSVRGLRERKRDVWCQKFIAVAHQEKITINITILTQMQKFLLRIDASPKKRN